MLEVKEGLNRMLNMIHEEAEESVATAWKDLKLNGTVYKSCRRRQWPNCSRARGKW